MIGRDDPVGRLPGILFVVISPGFSNEMIGRDDPVGRLPEILFVVISPFAIVSPGFDVSFLQMVCPIL